MQPDSNVFVFGPNIQYDDNGNAIAEKDQIYVWVDGILKKLNQIVNPLTSVSSISHALKRVVRGVRKISGDNVMSGIITTIYLLGE